MNTKIDMLEERKLIINLLCPSFSLSKVVQLVAWEDERIDLASISRKFGVDPVSIKINGHLISRGLDFVASSVTWKSLLSFFSARGLSTGVSASHPLIVGGKLCRVGTKRAYDPTCAENVVNCTSEWGNKQPLDKDHSFFKKSRFMGSEKFTECDGIGLKRKNQLEVVIPRKKPQMYESNVESHVSSSYAVEEKKITKCDEIDLKRKNQLDAVCGPKKMLQSYNSEIYAEKYFKCDESNMKRKQQEDVVWPQKRMRMHETKLAVIGNI